ncbi:MAG: DUF927 domain-containing protein, partial [Lachnospiraceae bacterium]|nr:DUF927 domain-containing protein [Lachnospiraceae bacterium]
LSPKVLKKNIAQLGGIYLDEKKLCEFVEMQINKALICTCNNSIRISASHRNLGWKVHRGVIEFDADKVYTKGGWYESTYAGRYDITAKGDKFTIKCMLEKWVIGNVPMQAVLALGAGATALAYSNVMWSTHMYNPIVHLISNSSRGKSTAANLIASFIGQPEGNNSMFLTFLATCNAILKRIGSVSGVPIAIDEFSTARSKKEWSDFIYTLSNGYDKDRCTAGGNALQETAQFQTVFVSNGENSILKKCNSNEGIRARLFEFFLDSFTRSAEEADAIKSTVANNYGILTPLIAQELMKASDYWNDRRCEWKEKTRNRIKKENIALNTADRITEYVALFSMSCELIREVLEIELDVNEVFEFFYLHMIIKNAECANIGVRTYEYMLEYFSKNKMRFFDIYPDFPVVPLSHEGDYIGYRMDYGGSNRKKHKVGNDVYPILYILRESTVEEILKNRGFEDIKVAMKDLARRKLLRTHGDRPTWEFPFNEIKTRAYAFWVKDSEIDMLDAEEE